MDVGQLLIIDELLRRLQQKRLCLALLVRADAADNKRVLGRRTRIPLESLCGHLGGAPELCRVYASRDDRWGVLIARGCTRGARAKARTRCARGARAKARAARRAETNDFRFTRTGSIVDVSDELGGHAHVFDDEILRVLGDRDHTTLSCGEQRSTVERRLV
jgi:hypothetical protein|eukprot:425726-Prymnesium_polylepis.1